MQALAIARSRAGVRASSKARPAALMAQLSGVTNAAGWIIVAFPAVFALGYGYFRFVAPNAE